MRHPTPVKNVRFFNILLRRYYVDKIDDANRNVRTFNQRFIMSYTHGNKNIERYSNFYESVLRPDYGENSTKYDFSKHLYHNFSLTYH